MAVAIKHMASNFAKLKKFEGVDFRRWQKKMHFLLSSMSVVYVLTTPVPDDGGDIPNVNIVGRWPDRTMMTMLYNETSGVKRKHHDTKADPNKKPKVTCWKYGKPGHLKKDCKAGNVGNKANRSGTKGSVDGSSNSLKGHNMFDNYLQIQRISLTGFPAQSVGSSNTDVLDSPCLLVLITGTSQSRQHGKSESDSYYLSD
ncbi:zinc finger, CCHC-type containing protein [Tanacetum coccineum]